MKTQNKKQTAQATHRLFILKIDKTIKPERRADGLYHATKWEEVQEVSLGSINKPNKEVLQFKLIPMDLEKSAKRDRYPFEKFFKMNFEEGEGENE